MPEITAVEASRILFCVALWWTIRQALLWLDEA